MRPVTVETSIIDVTMQHFYAAASARQLSPSKPGVRRHSRPASPIQPCSTSAQQRWHHSRSAIVKIGCTNTSLARSGLTVARSHDSYAVSLGHFCWRDSRGVVYCQPVRTSRLRSGGYSVCPRVNHFAERSQINITSTDVVSPDCFHASRDWYCRRMSHFEDSSNHREYRARRIRVFEICRSSLGCRCSCTKCEPCSHPREEYRCWHLQVVGWSRCSILNEVSYGLHGAWIAFIVG